MFCSKCGQEVPEGAAFCSNCGQQLAVDTSDTQVSDNTALDRSTPTESTPYSNAPQERKRRIGTPLIIGIAAAAAIIVVAISLLIPKLTTPDDSMWVISSIEYSNGTWTYERDKHGNVLSRTLSTNDGTEIISGYTLDEDGYPTSSTFKYGQIDEVNKITIAERDEQGRPTRTVYIPPEGNTYEAQTEYHPNGALKIITIPGSTQSFVFTYDDAGLLLEERLEDHYESGNEVRQTTFSWEKDSSGKPTNLTVRDSDGEQIHYAVEADSNGNIVRLSTDEQATIGSSIVVSWARIDHPSQNAQANGRLLFPLEAIHPALIP